MTSDKIFYHKIKHIGRIVFNRNQKGYKEDLDMTIELREICNTINSDEDVYVVVVSGIAQYFYQEIKNKTQLNAEEKKQILFSGNLSEPIASLNCPSIAIIDGDAIGEGLELALACDLLIASNNSRFGLPQITQGLMPMNGGTQRLSRIVGKGKALEMILTGEIIDSSTALEIGLVTKLVPQDQLTSEGETTAKNLAAKAPFALRYCKEAINHGLDMTLEQGLGLEADLYFLLQTTSDRAEGIQSFMQKRPPKYKGR
jgi:enoyl-CoA hydratase